MSGQYPPPPPGQNPPSGPYGPPNGYPAAQTYPPDTSDKLILVGALLCFFVGVLGVHRFYVGKIGTGVLMILTLGGLGIWTLIDLIMLVVSAFKDKDGRTLRRWT